MGCLVCQRIAQAKRGENPYLVRELRTGFVVIGDYQRFPGYSLFLYKEHVPELHMLPREEKLLHLEEMSLVTEAVYNAFRPDKINCESLGNEEAHLHWHIFPRRNGDTPVPGPVWMLPTAELYAQEARPSPAQLEALKSDLDRALLKLLG